MTIYVIKPLKWEKFKSESESKLNFHMAVIDHELINTDYSFYQDKSGAFYLCSPDEEEKIDHKVKSVEAAKEKLQKHWEKHLKKFLKVVDEYTKIEFPPESNQ